ncbi:type II toxin-antitoxin system RelE/ParE family toxin [Marinobacterium sp. D7]|uniref:type II toxin-antitoxin system RelE family toxin n=1 Tax=Marinobacterium ramblicola TaxID=2849041 RepID=UPI001C2DDEFD|nr:type II toxin-antitoxin system RelE/ParE family toxin [Marinobacterium ramblicola]MBV1788632.1 type II toxin-antitoxin system RelE/ParE family toxin [Marinobacterium ramblicola]
MTHSVEWKPKAVKQAKRLAKQDRIRIVKKVTDLADWPACMSSSDIKPLRNHTHQYRLRVGNYRVLFDVETGLRIISIEEVKKRDERTY